MPADQPLRWVKALGEARPAIFEYIAVFRHRILFHATIGNVPQATLERRFLVSQPST